MRWRLGIAVQLIRVAAGAIPVAAQTAAPATHPCDIRVGQAARVCRAGYDAIAWMVPAGGLALTAGNPVLGTAGGGQGFGDLTVTLRANHLRTVVPSSRYDGTGDTVAAVRRLPLALARMDLRVGLIRRQLPVGVASLDLLGTILPIPKHDPSDFRFGPEVRSLGSFALGFGYGLRLAMAPREPLPVVSLNLGKSDLPAFRFGDIAKGSTYAYTLSISAIHARLLAGKRLGLLEVTGGGGVDLLTGNYSLVYVDPTSGTPFPRADSTHKATRFVALANAALKLGPARVGFEGGFQVGKDQGLATVFRANDTRSGTFFGGVGIGFKL